MCTFKKILITNRHICKIPLINQLEKVLPDADMVILREKDMKEAEYEMLAREVISLCGSYKKECVLHSFTDVAERLGHKKIHLPLPVLRKYSGKLSEFDIIGVSVHSLDEAIEAVKLKATYLAAGHVFETDCKKGVAPRGIDFLKEICEAVPVPVYGLGGINDSNEELIKMAGAKGACRMSDYMKQ